MSDPVEQALALWGMAGAAQAFVAGRENRVYRIDHGPRAYAMRFKRPGYRSREELASELDWMAAMERAGLRVPRPVASAGGAFVQEVGGALVDVITWLDGVPMGQSRVPLELADAPSVFEALGAEMARLHLACDDWALPEGFRRCRWDAEGLVGAAPVWGRFWENPWLDGEMRALMEAFRAAAAEELAAAESLDQGLIHGDLVRENVMLGQGRLGIIDFDDGGFGYRLFDVATALVKNRQEPEYPALEAALIAGYRRLRPLDTARLGLFLALRAVTYLGWIVPRMGEPGAEARNARFVADARALCSDYLAGAAAAGKGRMA